MSLLALSVLLLSAHGDTEVRDAKLGVTFVWAQEDQTVTSQGQRLACGAPYREEVDAVLPRIRALFSTYGREVLSKINLKGARFCRDLVWRFDKPRERIVDGATDIRTEQAVGGLAVYSESRIYIDVASALRGRAVDSMMHHEIFHFVDRVLDPRRLDAAWRATHPRGARYAGSGFDRIGASPLAHGEYPGFVSAYATASPAEDRAELFSWWRSRTGQLAAKLKSDAVLKKKSELLAKTLKAKLPQLAGRLPRL
ncbi:MAG: hypothetical protein RIT81_24955 [Deltaproteobacteria bacterium]